MFLDLSLPYKVADMSLAEWGRKEIEISEHEMPGLMAQVRFAGGVAAPDRTGSQLYFEFGESAAMTVRRFMPFFGRRPCLPLCGFDSLRRESVSQCGRREPTIRQEIMYN